MNKKILITIFLLMPVACVTLVGSANYVGICVPKMRILSDEEKIEAAIALINQQDSIFVGVDKYCKSGSCKRIPYLNIGEFLEENPNSCKVAKLDEQQANDPIRNFWNRVLGLYSGEVSCNYKVNLYDDRGKRQSIFIESTGDSPSIFITNCGKIFDW